jgi:hypothetical protein
MTHSTTTSKLMGFEYEGGRWKIFRISLYVSFLDGLARGPEASTEKWKPLRTKRIHTIVTDAT